MVSYDLQIKVDGMEAMQNKMRAVEAEIKDFTSVFHLIADDFRRTEKKKFDKEGAYDDANKWEALSPEYAKRKQKEAGKLKESLINKSDKERKKKKKKKIGFKKILEYSGKLKESLINKGDANHILVVEPKKMEIGTKVSVGGWNLARLHHHGTKRLPKRPIIEITSITAKRWTGLMYRGIRQTLKGGLEKYKSYRGKT